MNKKTVYKKDFEIGVPTRFHAMIDRGCNWDFGAPLHIMKPLHICRDVGGDNKGSVENAVVDLLIDVDCFEPIEESDDFWPYDKQYLKGLYYRAKKRQSRKGITFYDFDVIVKGWEDNFDYDIVWRDIWYRE